MKNIARRGFQSQRGVTLVVALLMLIIITVVVVSAINSSTINLRIAGNAQIRDEARYAAQQAIEQFISSYSKFYPAPADVVTTVPIDINRDGTTDYTVSIPRPKCVRVSQQIPPRTLQCASGARSNLYCWDSVWEVTATATDTNSGVSQTVTQGVSVTFDPLFLPSSAGC
ncbi:MAG: pilus assembly PilX N-terminal domain-containing protein [Rhodocyclaceae bacterium]|nr:pilus assembly PilX N-terminal domain-containing protein [Rhodocyclaceae bacterium]MBX3667505.1 pilus assembly PilX N-terminal domain-containing protein [Rhodocyclaceae bacterium]